MTCPTCHAIMGARDVICRPCTERRGRNGAIEQQRQYITAILEDGLALKLSRVGHRPAQHVQLFGHRQAFCGLVMPVQFQRSRVYSAALKETLCKECLEVLDSLIVAETMR